VVIGDVLDSAKADLNDRGEAQSRRPLAYGAGHLWCRIADDSMAETYNLFLLEAIRIWTDPDREEQRTLHHRGDGFFTVDGEVVDLRERMVKWRHLPE
jgi:hypothetical protein